MSDVRQEAERILKKLDYYEHSHHGISPEGLQEAACIRALLAQLAAQEQENARWKGMAQLAINRGGELMQDIATAESARDAALAQVAQLREALQAIINDAVGHEHDPLWIVRRDVIQSAAALAGPPEGQP